MSLVALPISVATSGQGWASAWKGRAAGAQRMILAAVAEGAVTGERLGAVEVEFSSDLAVRALNRRFRNKNKPTNVLSFTNPSAPFGSIILAYETIRREAAEQNKPFINHSKHMILHGFLHLIGYDHETVSERRLMERLEIRILGSMGIPNPYLLPQ